MDNSEIIIKKKAKAIKQMYGEINLGKVLPLNKDLVVNGWVVETDKSSPFLPLYNSFEELVRINEICSDEELIAFYEFVENELIEEDEINIKGMNENK